MTDHHNSQDLNDLHRRALESTAAIIATITADQWRAPTCCAEWDVRALTNHVVTGNLWAAELAAGKTIEQVGSALDGDVLGDDPLGAYHRSASAATTAFEAPGALESPCAVSYGPVPGSVYIGHRIVDVFIHGWDLADATGHPTNLDPELVTACLGIVEPQLDALRASGAFGPTIETPDGVDRQTQLLSWLGRQSAINSPGSTLAS
jgi:uncharacterized protein (TIGR03086 family)